MNLAQLIEHLQALATEIGPDARVGIRDTDSFRLGAVLSVEQVSTAKRDPEKLVYRQGVRTVCICTCTCTP